jgi:hypothetical protein
LDGVKGEDVPFIAAGVCVASGYIGGKWFGKRNAIGPSPKGFVDILDALNYADSKGFGRDRSALETTVDSQGVGYYTYCF